MEADGTEFLISSARANGARHVEWVAAPGGAAAVAAVEARGARDVILHTDEVAAALDAVRRREAAALGKVMPPTNPDVMLASRFATPGPLVRAAASLHAARAFDVLAVLPFVAWQCGVGGLGFLAALGSSLVPVTVGLAVGMKAPGAGYARLCERLEHRDAPGALRALSAFERQLRRANVLHCVGSYELATRRSQAVAITGNLPGAMQAFDEAAARVGVPEWAHRTGRATLLIIGHAQEGVEEELRRSIEIGPPCATLHADLAYHLAWRLRRGNDARAAFEQARALVHSDIITFTLPLLEALVRIEEGRADEALTALREAEAGLSGKPPLGFLERTRRAALVVALAASGRRAEAESAFAALEAQLRAKGDAEALARCRDALDR